MKTGKQGFSEMSVFHEMQFGVGLMGKQQHQQPSRAYGCVKKCVIKSTCQKLTFKFQLQLTSSKYSHISCFECIRKLLLGCWSRAQV